MNKKTLGFIFGTTVAVTAMGMWVAWPQHTQFKAKMLSLTSPTEEPEKSPLAFVEHYHLGLMALLPARMASTPTKYPFISPDDAPIFFGLGASLIASELIGENPFGTGKTPQEIAGNLALAGMLIGWMIGVK